VKLVDVAPTSSAFVVLADTSNPVASPVAVSIITVPLADPAASVIE
jgi:hypothetical protein